MEVKKDVVISQEQLLIVQKYETVINYLYPIAQNIPRKHGQAKLMFLECMLEQVKLFIDAGKSNQVSKLYIADSGLSQLRFWIRFFTGSKLRCLTFKQAETALTLISEVGALLGSWIGKHKKG